MEREQKSRRERQVREAQSERRVQAAMPSCVASAGKKEDLKKKESLKQFS